MTLQLLLFILSASLDNLIVGLGYGLKQIRIGRGANLLIAVLTGLATCVSMLAGTAAAGFLPERVELTLGSLLLILIGVYFIFSAMRLKYGIYRSDPYDEFLRHPEIVDKDHSSSLDLKEATVVGLALSLNNAGLGVGASIIGLNPVVCSILAAIFSLALLQLGAALGDRLPASFLRRHAECISGLCILILGLYSLLA